MVKHSSFSSLGTSTTGTTSGMLAVSGMMAVCGSMRSASTVVTTTALPKRAASLNIADNVADPLRSFA
jgi:hypothetical protein